jgi:acetate---CoA ligase (ADP-forming) subunit beta
MMDHTVARSTLLPEPLAAALLGEYGIEYVAHEVAVAADEAVAAAERLGFPVVLKVVSPDVVHKSDAGGVVLGLADPLAVSAGFAALVASVQELVPGARIDGVLVCRQVAGARAEMIVGAIRDETFGPTVMLGAGGVLTEVIGDVSFRLAPLTHADALDMLRELRSARMLTGFRNVPPLDLDALAHVVVRLGDLLRDRPEVREVDLNPVLAFPDGCVAVDARILTTPGDRA